MLKITATSFRPTLNRSFSLPIKNFKALGLGALFTILPIWKIGKVIA
jgi:hypothetical protein